MRVAILCAFFVPNKSYQENIWAEQLAKGGHSARLFHAGDRDELKRIAHPTGDYEALQVRSRSFGRSTYWCGQLNLKLREFRPDLIIVCGDKTFAVPVAKDGELAKVPLISTFSENLAMHEFDWLKRGISLRQRAWGLGFIILRGWPIRVICRRSTLIVGNTPQAHDILARLFSKRAWAEIRTKLIDMPLGFSPDHFGYFPDVRRRVRQELGVKDSDALACVSSHFAPVKEPSVKLIITSLAEVMKRNESLKAVIVGFSDKPEHAAVSARIAEHIASTGVAERFIKLPFANRERLCELYNASDIAIFNRASISCQEALGTGLIGCFANDGSLNHLVTLPDQGFFFQPGDTTDLAGSLGKAVAVLDGLRGPQRDAFRQGLAAGSQWLAYDRIIQAILDRIPRLPRL